MAVLALSVTILLAAADSSAGHNADRMKVVGLYSVPMEACSLVAAAGFNVIHHYQFETGAWQPEAYIAAAGSYLDMAHHWNLRVALGLPRAWASAGNEAALQQVIRALSNHPALFAWYEEEMFLKGDLAAVELMHRVVRENDPQHGLVVEESKADPRLLPLGRYRVFTWYPVTDKARRRGRMISVADRFPVDTFEKPPWPSLQIFGRDGIAGYEGRDFLEPTWRELQYCLYASLIAGAPAVFFYSYLQPTRYDDNLKKRGRWPWVDYQAIATISPGLWRTTLRAVEEWIQVQAWISHGQPVHLLEVPHEQGVQQAQWQTEEGLLLIVSNATYTPRSLQVDAGDHRRYRVLRQTGLSSWQEVRQGIMPLELPGPGGVVVLLGD